MNVNVKIQSTTTEEALKVIDEFLVKTKEQKVRQPLTINLEISIRK